MIAVGGAPSIGSDTEAGVSGDMFNAMRQTLQMQLGNALLYEMTEESQASARTLFEHAIELDPDFS